MAVVMRLPHSEAQQKVSKTEQTNYQYNNMHCVYVTCKTLDLAQRRVECTYNIMLVHKIYHVRDRIHRRKLLEWGVGLAPQILPT